MKPWVMISFGVAWEFPGEPHFTTYRLAEPFTVGGQRVESLGARISTTCELRARRQDGDPAGLRDRVGLLERSAGHGSQPVRGREGAGGGRGLRRLEAHYPGLSAQVEMTDVATPYTTWRYTLNWRGVYEGWLPTGSQMMTALPRHCPAWRTSSWPGSG